MPLQNRVLPDSSIVADSAYRGMFMGNRGCLHNDRRELVKQRIALKRWICCALEFNGRKRELMKPGNYTKLFFLDELTALAAGHRPCAECRRADYKSFVAAWSNGNQDLCSGRNVGATSIDAYLDSERRTAIKTTITLEALYELPAGVILKVVPSQDDFVLWSDDQLFRWTVTGYLPLQVSPGVDLEILTPSSIVNALRSGYRPVVHHMISSL